MRHANESYFGHDALTREQKKPLNVLNQTVIIEFTSTFDVIVRIIRALGKFVS